MQTLTCAQQAMTLAAAGQTAEALALLERCAKEGDAQAVFVRGLWLVEGSFLHRDLVQAREEFRRAAELGERNAARVHAGFVASGVGGTADWEQAVKILDRWAGDDPIAARQLSVIRRMNLAKQGDPSSLTKGELLHDAPRVELFRGLFSAEECELLADLAGARFQPALIFHEGIQQFVRDPIRDSHAAGFPLVLEWPFVHAFNRRIAAISSTDIAQGETLQILRYGPGQQYRPHLDAIPGLDNQRVITVIVYLNDEFEGGETHFLESDIFVRGQRGDALLFHNALADGRPDPAARHAGCPVRSGTKLIASRWIRQRPPDDPRAGFGQHETRQRLDERPGN